MAALSFRLAVLLGSASYHLHPWKGELKALHPCPGGERGLAHMSEAPGFRPGIIVYTKHGCPLCDGLVANLADLQQHVDFELTKRWIEDSAEWEALYRYEVPVLVGLAPGGAEMDIPRPSPRASGVFLLRWLRKYYFEALAAESAG
jgi:hypothetical protein